MNTISSLFKKPAGAGIIALILGIGFGLLWGWVIQPVQWVDAAPDVLRPDYQEEYLRMTIDSFALNHDPNLAVKRYKDLGADASKRLQEIQAAPGIQDQAVINSFAALIQAAAPEKKPDDGPTPPKKSPYLKYALIALALAVVFGVGYFVIRLLRPGISSSKEATPAMQAQEINRNATKTDFSSMGLQTPLKQIVTTYLLGDNLYDESFSIETQAGEFMGEYGVGVSETIGVGDPKKVTAMEVWLFDKNDIKTATKVLMSPHAYNDPEIRQKLEAKGELVLVEPGKQIVLETATLQLLATISDVAYGEGALPENSFFDRLTLELAVWNKEGAA